MREFLTVCEDLRRVADPTPLLLVSISTVLFVTGVGAVHTFLRVSLCLLFMYMYQKALVLL